MLCLGLPPLLLLAKLLLERALAESFLHLPAPQNVTIVSYNFQNTLKWSQVMGINSSAVSYRVEYRTKSDSIWIEDNSRNITKPEYNFTHVINEFDEVIFRVRTEQGELKSDWVQTSPFQARHQTILGPPREIDATVEANSIFVSYKAPFDNNSRFFVFQYLISYWETSADKDVPSSDKVEEVKTSNTKFKLVNLMEMTEYCFHIQAVLPEKKLHGRLSETYCRKTSLTETTRILSITLPFIFAVVVLIIIFFCWVVIKKHQNLIKSLWRPPLTIPLHYEKDLQNPQMTVVEEFRNCAGEDYWDAVSVISSVEQNPTVTNSIDNNNQEVHLLQNR
ncbi:interferon gamma receptor 2 [Heteronotia binoei]|uniref:interferon gamma receptor 2 n=1 Tax=Heteronotia binoei TaxID=13085 RepID=UPI00292E2AED|nr:interferon gamma receptor 2 [Heteronotia binoei]